MKTANVMALCAHIFWNKLEDLFLCKLEKTLVYSRTITCCVESHSYQLSPLYLGARLSTSPILSLLFRLMDVYWNFIPMP